MARRDSIQRINHIVSFLRRRPASFKEIQVHLEQKSMDDSFNYSISQKTFKRDLTASDQRADTIYLREVEQSQIYLGLFGKTYGFEDAEGISPTEREFDKASELHKTRLIYLTNHSSSEREAKQNRLINKAQAFLVRKRFAAIHELKAAVYASLVNYLIGLPT